MCNLWNNCAKKKKNEPNNPVLSPVKKQSMLMHDDVTIDQMKYWYVANLVRDEIMQYRNWLSIGSSEDFQNHPHHQYFLTHILCSKHFLKVSGIHNEQVEIVGISCHLLFQNTYSNCQVKHLPKKNNSWFQHCSDTPFNWTAPTRVSERTLSSLHWKWLPEDSWP